MKKPFNSSKRVKMFILLTRMLKGATYDSYSAKKWEIFKVIPLFIGVCPSWVNSHSVLYVFTCLSVKESEENFITGKICGQSEKLPRGSLKSESVQGPSFQLLTIIFLVKYEIAWLCLGGDTGQHLACDTKVGNPWRMQTQEKLKSG